MAALQGPGNPFPAGDSEIDWELLADWHEWCSSKGLKYDRIHDQSESLEEMLAAICAAGRATPRHDGVRWGVVIDRPDDLVVDHINPRNSDDFTWSRSYFDPPDAFRIDFFDETNEWMPAERIVPWPGHTGPIDLTETISMPGKTDPDEIWIETRRRMYELQHRSDSFTAIQSGAARVVTRGDLVVGSFDTLERTQLAARVISTVGQLIELDQDVSIEPDTDYAIRFRQFADADDVIGTSVIADVQPRVGMANTVTLAPDAPVPEVGEIIHFGIKAREGISLKVRGVEAGENFSSVLSMVKAAPEIDTLTDAEVPPLWNGRVGAEVDIVAPPLVAPRFSEVRSGLVQTGDVNRITVIVEPGTGSAAVVSQFRIEHSPAMAGTWTTLDVPVANGGATIADYVNGDEVDLRVASVAPDGVTVSPWSATVTITVGASDVAPEAPSELSASIGTDRVHLRWRNPPGAFDSLIIYRNTTSDFATASFVDTTGGAAGQISEFYDDTIAPATGYSYWVTAATASGLQSDAVGPAVIEFGPELLINGRTETDLDGWAGRSTGKMIWVDGRMRLINDPGTYTYGWQSVSVVAGRKYLFTAETTSPAGVPQQARRIFAGLAEGQTNVGASAVTTAAGPTTLSMSFTAASTQNIIVHAQLVTTNTGANIMGDFTHLSLREDYR